MADADDPFIVTSPMVGTTYLAAEPGGRPFVTVGDMVDEGDTLLVIEAMKVMNPIQCGRSGMVRELFAQDGMPVEYGQRLATIGPALAVPPPAVPSSGWTGRRSPAEHAVSVRIAAPIALDGLAALIDAIEANRLNDPDAQAALEAAKALHAALGELIALAGAGKPFAAMLGDWEGIRSRALPCSPTDGPSSPARRC